MKTQVLLISFTSFLLSCSNPLINSNSPGQTVVKWLQSVQAGHLEEAVGYWDAEKNKGELKSSHLALADKMQNSGGNEYIKVETEKINGEIAEVTFSSKQKSTPELMGIANLTKEKGSWKIINMRSR